MSIPEIEPLSDPDEPEEADMHFAPVVGARLIALVWASSQRFD
jgi:hypothetical protein